MSEDCLKTFSGALNKLMQCVTLIPADDPDPLHSRCNCFFTYHRTMKLAGCNARFSTYREFQLEAYVDLGHHVRERCMPYWDRWAAENPRPSIFAQYLDFLRRVLGKPQVLWFSVTIIVFVFLVCVCLALCKSKFCHDVLADVKDACATGQQECMHEHQESSTVVMQGRGRAQKGFVPDAREDHSSDSDSDRGHWSDSDRGHWPGVSGLIGSIVDRFAAAEPERREVVGAAGPEAASQASFWWQPPYVNIHQTSDDGHHIVHARPEVLKRSMRTAPPGYCLPPKPHSAVVPFPHGRLDKQV